MRAPLQKRLRVVYRRLGAMLMRTLSGERTMLTTLDMRAVMERVLATHILPTVSRTMRQSLHTVLGEVQAWRQRRLPNQLHRFQDIPPELLTLIEVYMTSAWTRYSQRVVRDILQVISQGDLLGWDTQMMEQRVGQILQSAVGYELERIVRTETTRLYNYALLWETGSYPEVVGYRYEVVRDPRTSSVCRPLAGVVVPKAQLRYVPPLHPNCRTVLVPLLEEDMPRDVGYPSEDIGTAHLQWERFGRIPPQLLAALTGEQRTLFVHRNL
jgi:SPP1 gp7 family putative phage head morphogenesis protein